MHIIEKLVNRIHILFIFLQIKIHYVNATFIHYEIGKYS